MKRRRQRTILALDPGLRELGFAVLREQRIVTSGVCPLKLLPQQRRLGEARKLVQHWVTAHRPTTIVLERTYRHPLKSLHQLHLLARWIVRFAKHRNIEIATYAPQTVRKHLTGNGWASKRELAMTIATRFPALRVYLRQDCRWKERFFLNLFDAVGLAVHHLSQPLSRSRPYG